MLLNDPKRKQPFGLFTLVLGSFALLFVLYQEFAPKNPCDQLKAQLQKGFFLQWMGDRMLLVTADKQQLHVSAASEEQACETFIQTLNESDIHGH